VRGTSRAFVVADNFNVRRKLPMRLRKYREIHWRVVNVLLRITSVSFIFVGLIFTVWAASLLVRPTSTLDIDGVPSSAGKDKRDMLYAGLTAVGIGGVVWCTLPFRPDTHDAPFFRKKKDARKI
jgi:hypothetical protein